MSDSIVAVKEYLKQNLSSQDPTPDFIGALPSIAAWRALIFCQSLICGGVQWVVVEGPLKLPGFRGKGGLLFKRQEARFSIPHSRVVPLWL